MYEYYNANPNDRLIDDCTVRSLSIALSIPYREAYDELASNGERLALMMDSIENVEDYLDERFERECSYSTTLEEFIKTHRYGTYVVSMNSHVTPVIEGIVFDTFNPLRKQIKCYWRIR